MNGKDTERLVYPKALKCYKSTQEAIHIFNDILKEDFPQNSADFYRAKKFLREGEVFFNQGVKNAKKLLGPLPEYVTADYQKWRQTLLDEYNILARSESQDDLTHELLEDEFLNKLMDKQEIKGFLNSNYDSQQKGKRNLSNIKVRIIFDKLDELIKEAKKLQKKIHEKRQDQ